MKIFLFVLIVFLARPVHALGVSADSPITPVVAGSNEHANLIEVIRFLRAMGDSNQAADLTFAMNAGKVFHARGLKYNGSPVEGLTTPTFEIYFDADVIKPHSRLQILNPLSRENLEAALRLFNTAVHELFHYQDFEDSLIWTGKEGENITYKRSLMMYSSYLRRIWETYEALPSGDPRKNIWLDILYAYARRLNSEFTDHNVEAFGEIEDRYVALPIHDGCVAQMSRAEFGDYTTKLVSFLGINTAPIEERFRAFDEAARYLFGVTDRRCLDERRISLPPLPEWTVGYREPGRRQEVLEISQHNPAGHIVVRKSGPNHHKVRVYLTNTRADIEEVHLQQFGEMNPNSTEAEFKYPTSNTVYVIVSEREPGGYPEDGMSFSFSERVYNADGTYRETPLIARRMEAGYQARIGLYQPVRSQPFVSLKNDSPFDPEDVRFHVTGVKISGKRHHAIRLSVPLFDGRQVKIYRAETGELVEFIPDDVEAELFKLPEDGDYYVLVSRLYALRRETYFPISVEASNVGPHPVGPREVRVVPMSDEDYRKMRAHRQLSYDLQVDLRGEDVNAGWSYRYENQSERLAFAPFRVVDLGGEPGTFVNLLPTHLPHAQFLLYSRNAMGEVRAERLLLPLEWNYFFFEEGRHYYLVIQNNGDGPALEARVQMQYRAATEKGPTTVPPKLLSLDDVKTQFGFTSPYEFRFDQELITGAHPRDFTIPNSFYQLYELEIPADGAMELWLPEVGVGRRFGLYKVDEDAWRAGRAALVLDWEIESTWSLDFEHRRVSRGRYIVAIETLYGESPGDTPFALRFVYQNGVGSQPRLYKFNAVEMSDSRLRP